jgi:nitrate reductase NapAB chaperone NapD
MGSEQSKCKCLYLPAQSGKTRKMEELIKEYKLGELFEPVDINIIISANNRFLVEQTKTRMTRDLTLDSEEGANDACIKGNVFSWTSGTKESNIKPLELAFRLLEKIEMVVICAHPTRLRYLLQTLESLETLSIFTKKINIWIDEADQSINLWSKYESILSMRMVNQVTLVSATFDSVLSKYKSLCVLPYFETHPDCYRGLKNSNRIEINKLGSAFEYVKHVIEANREALVKPGVRAFIPSEMKKKSHDEIAEFLHKEHGFVVLVVNGERKEILVPGCESIDLRCFLTIENDQTPVEFNTQLAKLYKENNWSRFPLAIVGFICVGRGITFQIAPEEEQHDGFMFDYGIIPPISCAAEAYQTTARLFGNVGHFPGYKPVDIYTNRSTFSHVEKKEAIAMNIARKVAEEGLAFVTQKEIKDSQNFDVDSKFDLHTNEFNTLAEASKFMRGLRAQGKTEAAIKRNEDGFILSSTSGKKTVLDYETVKREMTAWSKTSNFDVKKQDFSKKGSYGRLVICYKDTTDISSVVFIARVLVAKQ